MMKEDLINSIGQSFDAGMDGVILWDSSKNFKSRTDCQDVKDYLQSDLLDLSLKKSPILPRNAGRLCAVGTGNACAILG